jgi:hypothetical protein
VSQIEEHDFGSPKSVWISGPYLATSLELEQTLGVRTHVYEERKTHANDDPSSIIYYPIHRGMQPEQIQRILSAVSEGEIVVSRGILEAFLEEMMSWGDLIDLTPRQSDFLKLVASTSISQDEIVIPRELLEAFMIGAPAA